MAIIMLNIFKSPIIAVGTALSIACGLSTLFGIYLYFKNGGKFKYKKGYYREIIKSSLPLTLVRLFGSLLQPILAIIIPLRLVNFGLSKDNALSELGVVMGMTMPLLSIPSTIIGALCMILIPKISSSQNIKDKSVHSQIQYYIKFTISCVFIFIPIFIALGEEICSFVFNNSLSGRYLLLSSWIMLPMGLTQITTSILNALNQEKKTFIYFVISNLFLILGVFILPKYIGIQSMLLCIGISSTIQFVLNMRKIISLTNLKTTSVKYTISHILISIPIILVTTFTYNIFLTFTNHFIAIGLSSFISVLSYISLLFVFNILDIKLTKQYLFKFKKV